MQYILPKMPHQMSKRQNPAPGEESSVTISFKSVRDATFHTKLPPQPLSTGVADVKHAFAGQQNLPEDRVRLLHKKRPCPETKTLKDLVSPGQAEVEFSFMIMGGAGHTTSSTATVPDGRIKEGASHLGGAGKDGQAPAETPTPAAHLHKDEFWQDLKGFLRGRCDNDDEAGKISDVFRRAWTEHDSQK